jgi:hypothetical protein
MSRCIRWYQNQCLLSMAPQGCRSNNFLDFNDVHDREEATHDDQLVICVQHMEERFDERFERIMVEFNT